MVYILERMHVHIPRSHKEGIELGALFVDCGSLAMHENLKALSRCKTGVDFQEKYNHEDWDGELYCGTAARSFVDERLDLQNKREVFDTITEDVLNFVCENKNETKTIPQQYLDNGDVLATEIYIKEEGELYTPMSCMTYLGRWKSSTSDECHWELLQEVRNFDNSLCVFKNLVENSKQPIELGKLMEIAYNKPVEDWC